MTIYTIKKRLKEVTVKILKALNKSPIEGESGPSIRIVFTNIKHIVTIDNWIITRAFLSQICFYFDNSEF